MNKNIDVILNSAEYEIEISKSMTTIITNLKSVSTEASVASVFENELYHFIKTNFNRSILFNKESGDNYFRHKFIGRVDAISNGVIIEYKNLDKLDTEKDKVNAINQIENYLMQINIENGQKLQGILTNGRKVCYLYFSGESIKKTPFKSMDIKDLDRIIRSLLEVGTKQFDPSNIVDDFKLDSKTGITNELIESLFNALRQETTPKTKMLIEEWEVLFRLSESDKGKNQDIKKRRKSLSEIFKYEIDNNQDEFEALYVLQTAYAIIVKLIACKVINNLLFNEEIKFFSDLTQIDSQKLNEFMRKLEDGYVFSSGGIRNLLEGDFYSWYSDKNQWTEDIALAIKGIASELGNYASLKFTYEYSTIDLSLIHI